ncbi:M20 family metallopeptidase [Staphylococcus gallinarum]|uniref:M20 family metallopeptidase n=1 Tax=Staphylococcus gallinarum TaxID=1293 RepID=UPI000D1EC155|nr:M20 family metallopeptidase [Staphylococcus gallinarum]PTK89432.1 peptidase M20 [Staphylococcus gallinarum]PTK90258.1 peptidase M20 [Staphylococcus gallinarum]RIO90473.1 M20 family peptidase [Staphylococcus gallinarum]
MSVIQTYLTDHEQEILDDIKSFVKIESPTSDKQAVDEAGAWLYEKIQAYLEIKPQIIEQEETGNHIRFEFGEGDDQILISGHFDTVWSKGDLPLVEKGELLYGPGVIDMKTGDVQILWALRALKEHAITTNKKIVVLFNGDHEGIASPTSRPYIEAEARKSKYGLVAEAATGETGALKTFRKGINRYTIQFKGKSSHSGNDHQSGESAIREAAYQIIDLENMTDYEQGTTVNVGLIQGGSGINVRPENAQIKVDVRITTPQNGKAIDQQIHAIKAYNPQVDIEIQGGEVRPVMMKTEQTESLFQLAKGYAQSIGFELEQVAVGGGSDGSFIAAQGTPTLDGLGGVGGGPHARNEHINKKFVVPRTTLLAELIKNL